MSRSSKRVPENIGSPARTHLGPDDGLQDVPGAAADGQGHGVGFHGQQSPELLQPAQEQHPGVQAIEALGGRGHRKRNDSHGMGNSSNVDGNKIEERKGGRSVDGWDGAANDPGDQGRSGPNSRTKSVENPKTGQRKKETCRRKMTNKKGSLQNNFCSKSSSKNETRQKETDGKTR